MAKKRYLKAKTAVVKIDTDNVLMNEVSGANQPWGAKRDTELFDDELNEEF